MFTDMSLVADSRNGAQNKLRILLYNIQERQLSK